MLTWVVSFCSGCLYYFFYLFDFIHCIAYWDAFSLLYSLAYILRILFLKIMIATAFHSDSPCRFPSLSITQAKTDNIARIYQPKRYALSPKTTVTLAHLLAAREDLSKIIRTSSGISREKTACAINKVSFLSAFVVVKSVNPFWLWGVEKGFYSSFIKYLLYPSD